ncbi:DUF6522 family protein [Arenimonas sp.]|uniref:DUF6522 family protein n=1 Tax=Arenimonas sp. TaxID=1872635 RepID=UPI0035B0F54F
MTNIDWNDFDSHALSGVAEALDAAGVDLSPPDCPSEQPGAPGPVEVDAVLVAEGLGLDPAQVPAMVADRRIATLCERGVGEDAGLFRFTFYFGKQRFRLVTDDRGRPAAAGSGPA